MTYDAAAPALRSALTSPIGVDEVLAEMDREVALRGGKPPEPVSLVPQAAPPPPGPIHLREFLRRSGDDFISFAYGALLGREPDEDGLADTRRELAAGRYRIEIVKALRQSAEGRKVARPVPGLWRGIQKHRILRRLTLPPEVDRELPAIREAQKRAARQADAIEELERRVEWLAQQQFDLARDLRREPWAPVAAAMAERVMNLEDQLRDAGEIGESLDALRNDPAWPTGGAIRLPDILRDQVNRLKQMEQRAADSHQELIDQKRRLGLILAELRRGGNASPAIANEHQALLDPLYVSLEDRFRGTRADIKSRQAYYLPQLVAAGAGTTEHPIIDVGAGRGEFLELLKENDLHGRGVDLNQAMAAHCAALGLDCHQGDAVGYLTSLPTASVGAITGFHIVEHLPFDIWVALLDESLRVLKPGGMILFETPNPANLLVSSRWFYLDPTHRNPIPGELFAMIAEARGYVAVSVQERHPMQLSFPARDEVLGAALDRIFHGPQDYALTASKP